jgi:hypothetical protein
MYPMRPIAPLFSRFACTLVVCGLMMGVVQADDKKSDAPATEAQADKKKEKPTRAQKAQKSPEQRAAAAKRQFKRRDKDQDGKLTLKEFAIIPKKLTDEAKIERREKAMKRQFKLRDADGDGKLSQEEFAKPMARKNRKKPADAAKKARAKKAAAKQAKQDKE